MVTPSAIITRSYPTYPTSPIAGMVLWYDATQITGLADGASLSTWNDLSGNGINLGTAESLSPVYYKTTSANLINGNPTVWFVNASASGIGNGSTSVQTVNASDGTWTAYIVALAHTLPATAVMFSTTQGGQQIAPLRTDSSKFNAQVRTASGSFVSTGPTITTGVGFQGTGWQDATPVVNSRLNGTAGTSASVTGSNTGSTTRVFIGNYVNTPASGFGWDGGIGEFLIYASLHSGVQIATNEAYLKHKWGTP